MQLLYWISTSLVSVMLMLSSYTYLFHQTTINGVRDLGIPDFLRWELAILKVMAFFILIIPTIPVLIKEWTYAGVALFFITAIIAHTVHKDSIFITFINISFIGLLVLSRFLLAKVS